MSLTDHERRILAYLDQHGPTHRSDVVADLASPHSKTARGGGRGSNGATPLIMGRWCSRLIKAGLVKVEREAGYYAFHRITEAGIVKLRLSE